MFDEYHFGRFTNQYFAGTYLFDIHPPLGKLVLVFVAWLNGYDHTKCSYSNIQDQYQPGCKFMVLRATAAFFGSLTAPVFYQICRNWGGSVWAGLLCAAIFIMDNLNLTESRLILIDSQLIFWCATALLVAQFWWKRLNEDAAAQESWAGLFGCELSHVDAERSALPAGGDGCPVAVFTASGLRERITDHATRAQAAAYLSKMMGELERNLWCVGVGIATSSAISIKWTALATPGMIALESFFGFFFLKVRIRAWMFCSMHGSCFYCLPRD